MKLNQIEKSEDKRILTLMKINEANNTHDKNVENHDERNTKK